MMVNLPDNTIGISVDDADKSFYEVGWPKFKERGFPVTLLLIHQQFMKIIKII